MSQLHGSDKALPTFKLKQGTQNRIGHKLMQHAQTHNNSIINIYIVVNIFFHFRISFVKTAQKQGDSIICFHSKKGKKQRNLEKIDENK